MRTDPEKLRAWKQRSRKPMNRSKGIKSRFNKRPSVDGDSERDVRDDCDQIVRDILKLRDSVCITCWDTEGLQVGHFYKRGKHRVRWDLLNCNGQCPSCNFRHNTEPEHYLGAFIMKYGEAAYHQLRKRSSDGRVLSYVDLLAIRDGLRSELIRLKGIPHDSK